LAAHSELRHKYNVRLHSELRHKYSVWLHSEVHRKYNVWLHSELHHKYNIYSEWRAILPLGDSAAILDSPKSKNPKAIQIKKPSSDKSLKVQNHQQKYSGVKPERV
jgi:hypothetical protein